VKIARILGALVLGIAALLAGAFFMKAARGPDAGSESARRLAPGPHLVASLERVFVDRSRPTAANGDFAGAPERTLTATLWYPDAAPGPHPLLVYSHGFMSRRTENVPLAELLASHGYVVVSADYPLTNGSAPGGAFVGDVVNQPGDVAFLIDQMLGLAEGERPFAGSLDAERIGALGLSLGGLTTELATFHPRLRDPRIGAAVSIAGPASFFEPSFFAAKVPFLMIAGTADAIVDFESNAASLPGKIAVGGLLALKDASHAGFAAFADMFPLRLLGNPDALGCRALMANFADRRSDESPFAGLGGPEDGVVLTPGGQLPCQKGAPAQALAAGRQLMITRLAALAFFESQFAADPAARAAQEGFLRETLGQDFPEASFTTASR
jgi:predicted dienelactone hydrolase